MPVAQVKLYASQTCDQIFLTQNQQLVSRWTLRLRERMVLFRGHFGTQIKLKTMPKEQSKSKSELIRFCTSDF